MRNAFRLFRSYCLAAGVLAFTQQALALDVGSAPPPSAVGDNRLTIGSRTLTLPEGRWNYIGRAQGEVRAGGVDRKGRAVTVYAADVKGDAMQAGITLQLAVDSVQIPRGWNVQPCKVEGEIFRDDFGGGVKFPECLVVYKRRSHLSNSTGELFIQAQQWLATASVRPMGPVYEVAYTKYASSDYGVVRVFIPQHVMGSDEKAIAWARQLPGQLHPFFEKRITQATLPAFPSGSR